MRVAEADKALKGNTAFNEGSARAIKDEHKRETQFLKKIAATPLLELVISVVVQQTVAEGVSTGGEHAPQMWKPWEANGLRSRQHALYHAILAYGKSYMMVTPGVIGNEKRAVMVPLSPAQLVTVGTGRTGQSTRRTLCAPCPMARSDCMTLIMCTRSTKKTRTPTRSN